MTKPEANVTAGRKPKAAVIAPAIDPTLDQEKLSDAMVAMREHALEDEATVFEIGQRIGALQATHMWGQTFAAAKVRMFNEIRSLPKGSAAKIPVRQADGTFAVAKDVAELCQLVFGASYTSMFEVSQSLEVLGEEIYGLATGIGLNRSALRVVRALPSEKLEVVRTAISAGSTKAEVLSVIEDLAEKVQQSEAALTEAHAELEAATQLLADKDKSLNKAKAAQRRINAEPPDERMAGIQAEAASIAADVQARILGTLRQAILAVVNSGDERTQHDVFLAGLVGQVQATLTGVRDEFNLPQISDKPEWQQWAEAQEKATAAA